LFLQLYLDGKEFWAKKPEYISTNEFSSLSGLSVSQVSKLLREGKIKGLKESGKWMISRSQGDGEE
jgi:hypothetical protein